MTSSVGGTGGPRPAGALERDIRGSDLVVAGTVPQVGEARGDPSTVSPDARPHVDRLRSARVEILRVLSGDAPGPTVEILSLEGRVPSRPWVGLWTDQPLLLFIRSTARGHVVVDPTRSPIRTLDRIPPPEPGASAERAVAHELEQVILRADLPRQADVLVEATSARLEIHSPLDTTWMDAEAGPESLRRTAWVAVSLADGHIEALGTVPALFADPGTPEMEVVRNLVIGNVAQVRDPAAGPELARLLAHPRAELARSAARALRGLRHPGAAADLAGALDHPDQEVRYQALMGLAELHPGAGPAPSFERFRANEPAYRDPWKAWWRRRRAD
jgi:hypothetical protein